MLARTVPEGPPTVLWMFEQVLEMNAKLEEPDEYRRADQAGA
jgi:hypothetical protein